MKYLIVGLGNIGIEYENTRHNVGFKVVDTLASLKGSTFETKTLGSICQIKHKGRQLILLKPSTYMNLSGKAVAYYMQKESIPASNTLIILDDLALPFASQRLRPNGSDGGHNGLKSIDALLNHQNYPRLRIGIGNDYPRGRQADYVLSSWTANETEKLGEVLAYAAETVLAFCSIGLSLTMSQFNKK
jgi:peptidyl-tRNA hydrolase, PTH1 family